MTECETHSGGKHFLDDSYICIVLDVLYWASKVA